MAIDDAMHRMYRRIVEAVPAGIWIVDTQGHTVFCSERMAEILGTDVESMAAQTCFDVVFPVDLAEAQRQFALSMASRRPPFDFRLRHSDGSAVWVSISCSTVYDDSGIAIGLLGLFTDIGDRKRAEEDLRESEARFRNMADTAPVMIWVSGPDKLCNFLNKSWLEFRGRTMEQELGNGWSEGVHPDDADRCVATYFASFDERRPFRMEYRLLRADGEYRWVLDEGVPRFTADSTFTGYIGCCIDITEVKRLQEIALANQKDESLVRLARGVAHDFNNLLGAILANAELAQAACKTGSLPGEEILAIQTAAIRGGEIVRQLMAYSGEQSPLEQVDVSSLVREMLHLLKASISKKAILKTDLGEGLPAVLASPSKIRQLVMNLVINASEAIGDTDGVIRVTTERVSVDPEAGVTGAANLPRGDYLRLEVSDTGSGMTPEVQSGIFDPFFTTKPDGRGLGLAAVQGIARDHKGAINVVSSLGKGTRFEVLLPCADTPVQPLSDPRAQGSAVEAARVGATVLVVEDEVSLLLAVSKTLQKNGLTVIEASHGAKAVELFKANERDIAVVLLDVTLPGMSGTEVFLALQQIRPGVKIILTSAYSKEATLATFGGQDAWAFIRKPYRLDDLMNLIRKTCLSEVGRGATAGPPAS